MEKKTSLSSRHGEEAEMSEATFPRIVQFQYAEGCLYALDEWGGMWVAAAGRGDYGRLSWHRISGPGADARVQSSGSDSSERAVVLPPDGRVSIQCECGYYVLIHQSLDYAICDKCARVVSREKETPAEAGVDVRADQRF